MADLFKLHTIRHAAGVQATRYLEPRFEPDMPESRVKYENAAQAARHIGNPAPGSRTFMVMDGKFIFGDFIEALIVENRWQVEDLTISTLSLSQENVDSLAGLLNSGAVKNLNMVVSDFFYQHERGGLIPYMYRALDNRNAFQLAVAAIHTKICLIRTTGGAKITIHGSANLRTSSNVEQAMVEHNPALYDFNHEWHHAVLGRYATINKSLRRNELWQQVAAGEQAPTASNGPTQHGPSKTPTKAKPTQPDEPGPGAQASTAPTPLSRFKF